MKPNIEKQFLEDYEAYADALFRFASFQLSDREAAKDAVQDVFLNAWKYIAKGETVGNMRAFLYASVRNRIIDQRRRKKEESLDKLAEEGFDARDENAHRTIEQSAEARRVFDAIGSLDRNTAEPLLLRFAEGLPVKEIAEIMGESENAISVRIHRGIKKLQKILSS